jgi:PAS domain S-box-containing protein
LSRLALANVRPAAGGASGSLEASSELEQARDKATLLDLLVHATQDGIVDWDLRTNVETYNVRFSYLFGFDDETLADQPKEWRELVHPDDLAMAAELVEDHLVREWPFVMSVRMRHRCGEYRTILCRGAAQRDSAQRPVRMVIIFSDISDRIKLEERQRAIASALPDTVFRVARDGRVLELKPGNDHEASPFRALEEGRVLFECLPEPIARRLQSAFERTAGASQSLELASPRGPAQAIHHEVRVVEAGADEWVCIVRDVTDRHTLADRLLQSEKLGAIGHLAAGVAHEINTPMQYIGDNLHFVQTAIADLLCYGDRLKRLLETASELGSDDTRSSLADAERDADVPFLREELPRAISRSLDGIARMTTIVRALKTFAHPSGRECSPVDLKSLIESTVAVATSEWKYVAEVTLSVDAGLPHVTCAGGEISQVVLNLIVNAAHAIADRIGASGEKGRIGIECRQVEHEVELRISDTGTGIPEHARSKVFEPFFTTKEVGKGTGQGLAMAHACIVNHHHGSIRFETTLGLGTTFIIRLPIAGPPVALDEGALEA